MSNGASSILVYGLVIYRANFTPFPKGARRNAIGTGESGGGMKERLTL